MEPPYEPFFNIEGVSEGLRANFFLQFLYANGVLIVDWRG